VWAGGREWGLPSLFGGDLVALLQAVHAQVLFLGGCVWGNAMENTIWMAPSPGYGFEGFVAHTAVGEVIGDTNAYVALSVGCVWHCLHPENITPVIFLPARYAS